MPRGQGLENPPRLTRIKFKFRFRPHKPLIFGLFRAFPAFFGLIVSSLGNGGDGDGGDKGHVAVNFGVAFGEGANGGQVVFLELVSQQAEPPAEDHHISSGEREREFLRWRVLVVASVQVWLQRVINQLAGVKTTALVFGQVELDAGAILAGGGVAGIVFEVRHRR